MRASECRSQIAVAALMALAMAAGPAAATPLSIYNGLRETPTTKFGKADMDMMTQTVYRTLSTGEDGVKVSWENPATSAGGSVTPAKDPKNRPGCRLAQIENHFQAMRHEGGYILCKNKSKAPPPWQLVSPWPGG